MKSSKAEVIARCVWIGGIVVFIASLAGLPFYSGIIGVMIDELCMGTALIGIGLVVFGASANMKARRERLAPSPEAQHEILQNTSGIPDMSLCDISNATLTLYFVMDYQKHVKLNASYGLRTPRLFINGIIGAGIIEAMAYFSLHIRNGGVLLIAAACTLLALIVLPFTLAVETLKKQYSKQIPTKTTAVIVTSTGVHQISGKQLISVAWADFKYCHKIPGTLVMACKAASYFVPMDTFYEPDDIAAFIDTLNAMKDGKPVPEYDWSAYAQVNLSDQGVWPPPI